MNPEFRVYHQEFGMLYPGHFRLKYNRDLKWHMLPIEHHIGTSSPKLWTMMQCTGLKDRNGTKIYIGDIIKMYGGHLAEIKWQDGSFMYVGFYADIFKRSTEQYVDTADVKTVAKEWERSEVIGNIYENKELLNV